MHLKRIIQHEVDTMRTDFRRNTLLFILASFTTLGNESDVVHSPPVEMLSDQTHGTR